MDGDHRLYPSRRASSLISPNMAVKLVFLASEATFWLVGIKSLKKGAPGVGIQNYYSFLERWSFEK